MKNYKKLTCALLSCLLSCLSILSPVHCLEDEIEQQDIEDLEKLEFLYDQDGNELGVLYDGGQKADYMTNVYPKFRIYVWKDEQEINVQSDNIRLAIYGYDLTTYTIGSLINTMKATEGNYFTVDIANDPNEVYLKIEKYNEEQKEWMTYEFITPVIGTKTAGPDKVYELNLRIKNLENEEEDLTLIQSFLKPILDGISSIAEFFLKFGEHCINVLKIGCEALFVPNKDFLPEWSEEMNKKVEEKVPALSLPLTTLSNFITGHEGVWSNTGAGIHWNAIVINNVEYFPKFSYDFTDLINETPNLKRIRDVGIIFTNMTISLTFINYLRKKFEIIFGRE